PLARTALARIAGSAALAAYPADDYHLGNRIARAGYRLVLLPYTVETVLDSVTLGDVWRHLLRWSRTYRVSRPVSWFCAVVTHAMLWGCLSLLVTGGSLLGWAAFVGALGCSAPPRGIPRGPWHAPRGSKQPGGRRPRGLRRPGALARATTRSPSASPGRPGSGWTTSWTCSLSRRARGGRGGFRERPC